VNSTTPHKRRIRLIQPSIQLRLISVFAGLTALALVTQALVLGVALSQLAGKMGPNGSLLMIELPKLLGICLGLSAVLVFPSLLIIGIRTTFRISGPLYRMERHLEGVANGESMGRCTIRKDDQLQDFCDTLNRALDRTQQDTEATSPAASKQARPAA